MSRETNTFYADMLDYKGEWGRYAFAEDYKFLRNYCDVKGKEQVQLWEGSNKELFIFRNIVRID